MNIFEQASINKTRFASSKGDLTTEQLWDLPLTSKSGFDLDNLAKAVNAELKATAEESFVATSTNPAKAGLELKLEILKHVIAVKLAQNEAHRMAAQRATERRKLLDILGQKEDQALAALTPKTAEQRIHNLEGGEGDSFVTVEQALIAERDELRAALADRDARLAALGKQEPVAWKWEVLPGAPIAKYQVEKAGVYFEDPAKIGIDINCERSVANYKWTLLYAAAGTAPAPMELVLTFNFGTLVKAEFQDRILYEVDLSPKSYFEVCWAHGWAGDYETEEDAENECLSLCGYSRSIREVKPGDDGYKNPRQPQLTEKRFLLAAAGAAPNAWKDAILDVMTIYGMDAPTTDAPEKIIKDLIELATRVAIDPILVAGTAPAPEDWRSAVAMAYGHLWHINNEPMAPIPLRSEESASYAARKLLRDLLTTEERGEAINSVRAMLSSAPKDAP